MKPEAYIFEGVYEVHTKNKTYEGRLRRLDGEGDVIPVCAVRIEALAHAKPDEEKQYMELMSTWAGRWMASRNRKASIDKHSLRLPRS